MSTRGFHQGSQGSGKAANVTKALEEWIMTRLGIFIVVGVGCDKHAPPQQGKERFGAGHSAQQLRGPHPACWQSTQGVRSSRRQEYRRAGAVGHYTGACYAELMITIERHRSAEALLGAIIHNRGGWRQLGTNPCSSVPQWRKR